MNRNLRALQRGLDEILATTPAAEHVVAECQRALNALKPRHAPPKPGRTRAEDRAERRRKHAEETAAIREACMKRADGKCECCEQAEGDPVTGRLEMHHLLGGSGRRRQKQAVENCIMVCQFCHGVVPRVYAACAVEAWCKKYGYPIPEPVRRNVARIEEGALRVSRRGAREGA